MTADPHPTGSHPTGKDQDDATNQGVSNTAPAEGADDAPSGGAGSPEDAAILDANAGVITGETADER